MVFRICFRLASFVKSKITSYFNRYSGPIYDHCVVRDGWDINQLLIGPLPTVTLLLLIRASTVLHMCVFSKKLLVDCMTIISSHTLYYYCISSVAYNNDSDSSFLHSSKEIRGYPLRAWRGFQIVVLSSVCKLYRKP